MKNLIAITGIAGSGKDTLADGFAERFGMEKVSFARAMKKGVQAMFDLPDKAVFGDKTEKEKPIPKLKGITARRILQTLGTEWGRNIIDEDIWVHPVSGQWDSMPDDHPGMVISDLRFDNEAEWVKKMGGFIVQVQTPDHTLITSKSTHASELGVEDSLIDFIALNPFLGKKDFQDEIIRKVLIKGLFTPFPPEPGLKAPTPVRPWPSFLLPEACNPAHRTPNNQPADKPISDIIREWADEVFPQRTITNAISKLVLEEIPEYLMDQSSPDELADLGILIHDIAYLAGIDLDAAMRKKMEININREWAIDPRTGLINHVEHDS